MWQNYIQERGCLVHFLRLLAVCWPGALSARDDLGLHLSYAYHLGRRAGFKRLEVESLVGGRASGGRQWLVGLERVVVEVVARRHVETECTALGRLAVSLVFTLQCKQRHVTRAVLIFSPCRNKPQATTSSQVK